MYVSVSMLMHLEIKKKIVLNFIIGKTFTLRLFNLVVKEKGSATKHIWDCTVTNPSCLHVTVDPQPINT